MMLCRLLEKLDCTLVQGRSDIEVNAICCDSRAVTPGCVFVCLPGQHTDGRRFAHAAAEAGAAVLVFEDTLPDFEFSRSCSPALVQAEPGKARRVLALMAARLYGYPARQMTMIGITGTVRCGRGSGTRWVTPPPKAAICSTFCATWPTTAAMPV